MAGFIAGDTTDSLFSRTSRVIAPPPGGTLRATSVWEGPTHPIALAVGGLADAVGRVFCRESGVTTVARKVARTLGIAEGTGVLRVVTLLRTLLVSDL